jgi:hypothetical protein
MAAEYRAGVLLRQSRGCWYPPRMSPAKKKGAVELAAAKVAETVEEGLGKLGPAITELRHQIESLLSGLGRHPAKPKKKTKKKPSRKTGAPVRGSKRSAAGRAGKTGRRASAAK